jgi:DNA mismatch repair protein MutS
MSTAAHFSLLWPQGEPTTAPNPWQPAIVADLGLEHIIRALNEDGRHERDIKAIFLTPCDDAETIYYRQAIIEDFLNAPELTRAFKELLPKLSDLAYYGSLAEATGLTFQQTISRIGELELYVEMVEKLAALLDNPDHQLQSPGLRRLRDLLLARMQEPIFERLRQELPGIAATIRKLASITVGINLDHNLRPIAATLVSVNTEPFQGSSFFKKLFGEQSEFKGISQLHTVPMKSISTADGRLVPTQQRSDPMLFPLFKDLDGVITNMVRPADAALKDFLRVSTQFLAALEPEIVFYLGAARLINDLRASGLPMCRAQAAEADSRTCIIRDGYNVNLALRCMFRQPGVNIAAQVVCNDVVFDENGRIFIITGPNQGGKTTYLQGIALAQVLFQAGLYVPGTEACISPVDGIYTHFPIEEKPSSEAGRFGEEAQRLNEIFAHATRYSLILLNESLASTASGESLYLARDIVRCLKLLGVRAAYTTHMHELASDLDELNANTPGDSPVVSLVAVAQPDPAANGDAVRRTYKIIPSAPMGRSFAQELATRYGISFDKIVETLTTRRAIDPNITH